jgi:hypothetical protein
VIVRYLYSKNNSPTVCISRKGERGENRSPVGENECVFKESVKDDRQQERRADKQRDEISNGRVKAKEWRERE